MQAQHSLSNSVRHVIQPRSSVAAKDDWLVKSPPWIARSEVL